MRRHNRQLSEELSVTAQEFTDGFKIYFSDGPPKDPALALAFEMFDATSYAVVAGSRRVEASEPQAPDGSEPAPHGLRYRYPFKKTS